MTNATRAGINLGQSLARSPTVSRSMSGGLRDARYLRDSTIADAVTAPAYTITTRVLHWITAFRILCMIPLAVQKSIRLAGALFGKTDNRRSLRDASIEPMFHSTPPRKRPAAVALSVTGFGGDERVVRGIDLLR
jgi:hypothetical protein